MALSDLLEERLGRRCSAGEVAEAFAKSVGWVYTHATALGGRKVGGEWLFFENQIVEAMEAPIVGEEYANKEKGPAREDRVFREGQPAGREAQGKALCHQEGGYEMGNLGAAEIEGISNPDPFDLLA